MQIDSQSPYSGDLHSVNINEGENAYLLILLLVWNVGFLSESILTSRLKGIMSRLSFFCGTVVCWINKAF